jgi:hypothetical protein
VVALERALPPSLPAARATAIFCAGVCFDTERHVEALELVIDGAAHEVSAFGMPRPDLARRYGMAAAPGQV